MQVNAEVRKRRQDRIKQIQGNYGNSHNEQPDWRRIGPQQEKNTVHSDPRLNDPEYLWKRERSNRWDMADHPAWEMRPINQRKTWMTPPTRRFIWGKMFFCMLLFFAIWGMFQSHQPWAVFGQGYVKAALTEPYDFTAVAAWYEKTFKGAPSFLPAFTIKEGNESQKVNASIDKNTSFSSPLQGIITVPFSSEQHGILLQTKADQTANAIDTGWVIYVGNKIGSGLTVVVQHAKGYTSEYGSLGQTALQKNDWVEAGAPIGTVAAGTSALKGKLYFAVTKDGQYINPVDVVTFD